MLRCRCLIAIILLTLSSVLPATPVTVATFPLIRHHRIGEASHPGPGLDDPDDDPMAVLPDDPEDDHDTPP